MGNQLFKPGERIAIGASGGKGYCFFMLLSSYFRMFFAIAVLISSMLVHVLFVADSTVLAFVLSELNRRHNYGLDLFLLSIDEGISGYRDDSLETVKRNEIQVCNFLPLPVSLFLT